MRTNVPHIFAIGDTSWASPCWRTRWCLPLVHLTPLELIERIAALVPPPRTHLHRYFGVLAPNSPLRAAHCLWAVLIARIYEFFPLLCPMCGGHMRLIAFITHTAEIRHILNHIGQESEPLHIALARGPPLWDECDALVDD